MMTVDFLHCYLQLECSWHDYFVTIDKKGNETRKWKPFELGAMFSGWVAVGGEQDNSRFGILTRPSLSELQLWATQTRNCNFLTVCGFSLLFLLFWFSRLITCDQHSILSIREHNEQKKMIVSSNLRENCSSCSFPLFALFPFIIIIIESSLWASRQKMSILYLSHPFLPCNGEIEKETGRMHPIYIFGMKPCLSDPFSCEWIEFHTSPVFLIAPSSSVRVKIVVKQ